MKQLIVMTAMVALGIVIFNLIAGEDQASLLSAIKSVWAQEVLIRTQSP